MLAVDCAELTKTYHAGEQDTPALRGVNLQIHPGELFMLVGPSGCGKTTLISIIAGILNQDSGRCQVFGVDLNRLNEADKAAHRGKTVGFVFQALNLIPSLTTTENVAIPLILGGMKNREAYERAASTLADVGLGDKTEAVPANLSGGQQQRVAIARAIVHNPRLIVCDEPTSALDAHTGHQVMEIFQELAVKRKHTLVVVTHDSRIFSFASRVGRMNDGIIEEIVNEYV